MVLGVGIDIVENRRFSDKEEKFLSRIFTEKEISLSPRVGKEAYYASRFASKEAFVKALGTGFTSLSPLDIEIAEDETGRPYVVMNEKVSGVLDSSSAHLSISHEKEYSVAMVVIDGSL